MEFNMFFTLTNTNVNKRNSGEFTEYNRDKLQIIILYKNKKSSSYTVIIAAVCYARSS